MNKTSLYIQLPETNVESLRYNDTYLAPGPFGTVLGLEFSIDVTDELNVGDTIFIDKDNKSINPWVDGAATILGITFSTIYPAPASLVYTDRPLQLPISFTSGEAGTIYKGSTLKSNWTEVDLSDNVPFPITFNIADVREINNRNGAYSKTISIPGTKTNNDIFKYIFDIQGVDNYDTRIKVKCSLVIDTIPTLEGYIQLNSIKAQDNRYWTYECTIFGENANFAKEIDQNARLEDLDFSEFNHSLTIDSITQSWSGDWTNGYYYPLIDYNNGRDPIAGSLTGGISQRFRWFLNYLKPSIYAKQYWNKIFQTYGYTYESEFLNSDAFENLIIPTNKRIIENDPLWRFNSSFKAGITSIATYSTPTGLNQGVGNSLFYSNMQNPEVTDNFVMSDTAAFFYDPQNVFQDVLGPGNSFRYTNSYQGTIPREQKVILNLDFKITPKFTNGAPLDINNLYGAGFILFYTITKNNQAQGESQKIILAGSGELNSPTNPVPSVINDKISWLSDNYGEFEDLDLSLFNRRQHACIFDTSVFGPLNNNDVLRIEVGLTLFENPNSSYPVNLSTQAFNYDNVRFEIEFYPTTDGSTNGTTFFNSIEPELIDDQPFNLNSTIPGNIKQIDFVNSIIKMFNLYLYQDKVNPKKIFIEPRDQFYYTNQVLNWSDKLDISKEIDHSPIVDRKKRVLLSYKDDKDFFNADYKQRSNEVYGQYEYLTGNEIDTSDQKIEVIFSPSPLSNRKINDFTYDSRVIYTQILDPKQPITTDTFNKVDSNIRILYRKKINLSSNIKFQLTKRFPITTYLFDHYPYAGHLDDPFNSQLDLSFGEPRFIYPINNYGYTINNLYNEYYDQFFEEIYGVESKTITAYVYLNSQDILDFDYRKLIYIDNISSGAPGYFRVNRIEYDPFNKQSYKVELIKVLNNFKSTYRRRINLEDIGEALPDWGNGLVTSGGNTNNGDDNIIGGIGNSICGNFNFVVGQDNEVRNNSNNSGIIGNYNNTAGKNSFVTGYQNRIGASGFESSIIGGASSSLSGRYSSIIGGFSNIIYQSSENNLILGGECNKISYNSTGITPSVVNSNNFILGGNSNTIESGITQSATKNSFIIGGYGNTILPGLTNSMIMNGQNFTATQSNTIYLEGNVLINGNAAATVTPIPANQIAFGTGTGITSDTDFIFNPTNTTLIFGPSTNTINSSSFTSGIISSATSTINNSNVSTIMSSAGSTIGTLVNLSSVISSESSIISSGQRSTILSSYNSYISVLSNQSTILGGSNIGITNGSNYTIASGQNNNINGSSRSAIIGGSYNSLVSSQRSIILGGTNLSLTSTNDTVLVPNLTINDDISFNNVSGTATITSGTSVTVNNTYVQAGSKILVTGNGNSTFYVTSIVAGTSFNINAGTSGTYTIYWLIIN